MLRTEIRDYLSGLNINDKPFTVHDVAGKIREVIQKEDTRSIEDEAEIFAFNVYTDESNATAWDSYFGPMASFPDKNGKNVDFPSRSILSSEVLEYWKGRFEESQHLLFKALYADLIIEFSNHLEGEIGITVIKESLNAHVLLSEQGFSEDIQSKQHIDRALHLSRKFKQTDEIERIFETALLLENRVAEDDKPGLWGFVLEWFLLDSKFQTSQDNEDGYIKNLEARRKRLLETESIWPLENATIGLAKYYKHKGDYSSVEGVLKEYEDCIRNFKEYTESSLGKHHYLQNLEEVYMRFGGSQTLTDRLNVIRGELRNFRLDPNDPNFKTISVTENIPQDKIDEFLDKVFESDKFPDISFKIIANFFLRKEREKETFDDLNKKYVFAKIVSGTIFDDENRFIATLPPLDEAPDLHFTKHCADNLQINSIFLSMALKRLKEKHKKEVLINQVKNSGINSEADYPVIDEMVELFWSGKYLSFIHIAVPFIESSLRRLFLTSGMVVSIENKLGGYDYKSINALLEHEYALVIFKQIFKDAGEDLLYTVRLIFTEKLGFNLRNKVAHGIHQGDFVNEKYSNQILLILLILSLVKINNK
jgi:hypothetical protein